MQELDETYKLLLTDIVSKLLSGNSVELINNMSGEFITAKEGDLIKTHDNNIQGLYKNIQSLIQNDIEYLRRINPGENLRLEEGYRQNMTGKLKNISMKYLILGVMLENIANEIKIGEEK